MLAYIWIIENNNHLEFDIEELCDQQMKNGKWYNKTTCSQLNGNFLKKI